MTEIINTWDQCVAAGGDRIAIYYHTASKWRLPGWRVVRMKNGRELRTDPKAHWEDRGMKTFNFCAPRLEKEPKLREAIAWAHAQYGRRDFVRNRMGDYVEREVNERFPIPPRTRKKRML